MKIVFITGSHRRHAFMARQIASTGYLAALVVERREVFLPEPAEDLDADLKALFRRHFLAREKTEKAMFGELEWPDCYRLEVTKESLNGSAVHNLLRNINPSLLLSYGCHKLSRDTVNQVDGEAWNCHGGLSPWYKGAVTHFWPSYLLEPQMTGMTVHDLTEQLDAGAIVHQCVADLVRGDGLHDLAARAVLKLGKELPPLIERVAQQEEIHKKPQDTNGMLWLTRKWRPEHLRLIYELYNDDIVDQYLDGKLAQTPPKIFRQF